LLDLAHLVWEEINVESAAVVAGYRSKGALLH